MVYVIQWIGMMRLPQLFASCSPKQIRKENWLNTHLNTVRFAEVPKTFEQKAAKEQVG